MDNEAQEYMGTYKKHSIDTSGRIVFQQENGDNYLSVNKYRHWIVSLSQKPYVQYKLYIQ